MASYAQTTRSGLPRVPGGAPWPPTGVPAGSAGPGAAGAAGAGGSAAESSAGRTDTYLRIKQTQAEAEQLIAGGRGAVPGGPVPVGSGPGGTAPGAAASVGSMAEGSGSAGSGSAGPVGAGQLSAGTQLRRGLPRVPGGEAWPPAGTVAPGVVTEYATGGSVAGSTAESAAEPTAEPAGEPVTAFGGGSGAVLDAAAGAQPGAVPAQGPGAEDPVAPCHPQFDGAPHGPGGPFPHGAPHHGADPHGEGAPHPHHHHHHRRKADAGERTAAQRAGRGALWGAGIVVVAGVLVLAAKGVTTLPGVPEFLERFPGQYEPAVETADGFPAWARWSHFLNLFFMVLIVRTGLQVRRRQKPPAFFTPKRGGRKISLDLWLHTSVDVFWFANGVAFVVLLFVSGHWARIVPTSWEVFPNAVSAALQYATLDWPIEDGWVNYNSLQQLMYFLVVFVAAPLAAATGLRMSEWWPEGDTRMSRAFPAPVARAVHYPVMLFFVLFTVIHVFLVLTTGALRNLNHMFAGNPGTGWFGFWMFAAALAAVVAVWFAARPIVVAPIASLFGRVSNR